MTIRDLGCDECRRLSSGDCGKHGPISMTIGEVCKISKRTNNGAAPEILVLPGCPFRAKSYGVCQQTRRYISALLDLLIRKWPTGGFLVSRGIGSYRIVPPPGAESIADELGWIGWWFREREDAIAYIHSLLEERKNHA